MPVNKDLKRQVRARMQKTGERYSTARSHIVKPGAVGRSQASVGVTQDPGMSDAAVRAKTGRTWTDWLKALDTRGGREMVHRELARSLVQQDGLTGWWAQTVSIGYERMIGRRSVGQRSDGSFATSKSKTFTASPSQLYRCFRDARLRHHWWQGDDPTVARAKPAQLVRLDMSDDSRAEVTFVDKGAGRCTVSVQHRRLPSQAAIEQRKIFWSEQFRALVQHLRRQAR